MLPGHHAARAVWRSVVAQLATEVSVLQVLAVSKSYGRLQAVDGISLCVEKGTCYGLLGPNGAGKTTLISMIAGTMEADSGEVRVGGELLNPSNLEAKRQLGYVPQELALYEDLSAVDNLRFFGGLYGLHGEHLAERCRWTLALAGLEDRRKHLVRTYSGGMKRRLNIAAALLHNPELLILDEPTVGVDPQSRNQIFESLEQLRLEGKTLLYTTHYMEEVERLCQRVGIIDHGKLIAEDTISGLKRLVDRGSAVRIELEAPFEGSLAGVSASVLDNVLTVQLKDVNGELPGLLAEVVRQGSTIVSVSTERPTLEEVFLNLTGRTLRD